MIPGRVSHSCVSRLIVRQTTGMTGERPLNEFIAAFGEESGVLPNGQVVDSDRTDWDPILRAFSDAGWVPTRFGRDDVVEASQLRDPDRDHDVFSVQPIPGLRINFFAGPEILFDFDLRELKSEDSVQAVYDVIKRLGLASAKRVRLSREGTWDDVVVSYDPTTARFSWPTE